ncbi:hypothetical protein, conserved [Leishmania tarentolae]|uniref:Uncharacterized protein n=1 Tax=Leishmania tarentolae TaxID=5689 RepID=A0A640KWA7_LEITA|nr:hypothetical protein, conserved [Leishmania tarentolae]
MPLSPLIRPMSPLQTQSAPLLPEPYSLSDAVLQPLSAATSSAPASAWDQDKHFVPVPGVTASESRSCSPPAPVFGVGTAGVPPVAMSRPAPPLLFTHKPAPTFHRMVGDALSVGMLRESYAAQLQTACWPHSVSEGLRCTSEGTSPLTGTCLGSDSGVTKVFSGSGTTRFPHSRSMPPLSFSQTSPIHPYVSGAAASTIAAHKIPAAESSFAATRPSLLHNAAAMTMTAARPSYGAALLHKRLPTKQTGCREGGHLHLPAKKQVQRSSLKSLADQEANDRWEIVSPASPLSSYGCAAESGEVGASKAYTNAPFTASATCYHGTAVTDCAGHSHAMSIAASHVAGKGGRPAEANTPVGGGARVSHSRVNSTLGGANVETFVALPCYTPDSACDSGEDEDTFFDSPHGLSIEGVQATRSQLATESVRNPAAQKQRKTARSTAPTSRSSGSVASAPATGSAASPVAESYVPRYVYPALEECRRLLHEIRIVSPLMRRCLTPPRPLEKSSGGGSSSSATATSVSSAFSPEHVPRIIPAPSQSSGCPSLSAVTTAVVPPKRATLAPWPEARRLYHWDASTAAEDLSFMRGPFQQSSERFATSVALQLQRLQALGTRLYGKSHDPPTSQAEVHARASSRWSLPSSAPLVSPWASAVPHFDDDQCDCVDKDVDEPPSGRLRRLLLETEAALPISAIPSAVLCAPFPSTIGYARDGKERYNHSAHEGAATGRTAGASTPSMKNQFPFLPTSNSLTAARPLMLSSLSYGG